MVRAKFFCLMKREVASVDGNNFIVELSPVVGSAENKEIYRWAPADNIELNNINKCAADNLVVGKEYYVDFTEATFESCAA